MELATVLSRLPGGGVATLLHLLAGDVATYFLHLLGLGVAVPTCQEAMLTHSSNLRPTVATVLPHLLGGDVASQCHGHARRWPHSSTWQEIFLTHTQKSRIPPYFLKNLPSYSHLEDSISGPGDFVDLGHHEFRNSGTHYDVMSFEISPYDVTKTWIMTSPVGFNP